MPTWERNVLTLDQVCCEYGNIPVLRNFSLSLNDCEVLCLLGRNGAGKTTALKAIMGLVRLSSGGITLNDKEISVLPAHHVPRLGIGYVPQGRRLFSELTVRENLKIGLMTRGSSSAVMDRALALFPLLKDRLSQRSGTMSGGEQQMLAIARALSIDPKVLLLDEPTEGLMPSMIARIQEVVSDLRAQGVATLLVEQRVNAALAVADRVAFVDHGVVRAVATADDLKSDRALIDHYVGVSL
jgi:branched-chain amino acid transport system ATP-binding protein